MKIYDISRTISPEIAVWPGDQKFESRLMLKIADGSSVNLSSILLSTHTGTHADAPYHYLADGADITELPLEKYIGPALVVELPASADHIKIEHVKDLNLSKIKRILFKTKSSQLADSVWTDDIVYLGAETTEFLGKKGIQLVGMDGPSMDPVKSKTMDTHKMLARYGIVNLENLLLKDVPAGEYELIALPLKLKGLDASPVRAVLLEKNAAV
ncbi:arylformamidase [Candidatus Acetothermia bacterium]|nr:arylformamidase [Candidatus Acetothermia bacterium]MBI3644225.1 arylformamidase [Candidatus Acetothermia bacterium]